MTQNRKRGRNMCEDEVEFTPLSKRINNLHINGNLLLENQNNLVQPNTSQWTGNLAAQQQSSFYQDDSMVYSSPLTPPETIPSIDFNSTPQYSPELNETENPHYFDINKLLYQVHMERMQRNLHNY